MKYFSAQLVLTNAGPPLRRPVICTQDDGTIISVADTGGDLREASSVEFFNGILIPGFVNCHCHLELSWMKGRIPQGTGLGMFLSSLTEIRNAGCENKTAFAEKWDQIMAREGVVLCADICNSTDSFDLKRVSSIRYLNLLEVFGVDADKAERRISEIMDIATAAAERNLEWQLVPHSAYSVSVPLFRLLRERCKPAETISMHFMESPAEASFLSEKSGPLMEAYKKILSPQAVMNSVKDHVSAVLGELTDSANLILVHNTFITSELLKSLGKRDGVFYCLCPRSNLFIANEMPPAELISREGGCIVIGTDSLASNLSLSMMEEMKTIQEYFPSAELEEIVRWATLNGARALGRDSLYGSIEPGKKPGLVIMENCNIADKRLLQTSSARRII